MVCQLTSRDLETKFYDNVGAFGGTSDTLLNTLAIRGVTQLVTPECCYSTMHNVCFQAI